MVLEFTERPSRKCFTRMFHKLSLFTSFKLKNFSGLNFFSAENLCFSANNSVIFVAPLGNSFSLMARFPRIALK
jgi:hypothetical protein